MRKNYNEQCKECRGTGEVMRQDAEVLCNMCGNSMKIEWGGPDHFGFMGLVDAEISGGYHSYHLFDMTTYSFDMCEECLRKMFNQFKIPPDIYDGIGGNEDSWEDDQKAYEYRIWKDNGGHHQAYVNGLCNNAVKDCPNKAIYTVKNKYARLIDEFSEDCCCADPEHQYHASNYELVPFISNVLKPFL